jgi:hypothetical protein
MNSLQIIADPAQYTHLIFFMPAANKPGELCRIMILGIEIGFAARCKKLSCKNTIPATANKILKS